MVTVIDRIVLLLLQLHKCSACSTASTSDWWVFFYIFVCILYCLQQTYWLISYLLIILHNMFFFTSFLPHRPIICLSCAHWKCHNNIACFFAAPHQHRSCSCCDFWIIAASWHWYRSRRVCMLSTPKTWIWGECALFLFLWTNKKHVS